VERQHNRDLSTTRVRSEAPAKLKAAPGVGLMQDSTAKVGREGGAWEGVPLTEACLTFLPLPLGSSTSLLLPLVAAKSRFEHDKGEGEGEGESEQSRASCEQGRPAQGRRSWGLAGAGGGEGREGCGEGRWSGELGLTKRLWGLLCGGVYI
jgi:hypothetical protein